MAMNNRRVPRVRGNGILRQIGVAANAQMAMAMAVMLGMVTVTANVGTTKNGPNANGPKANGAPVDGTKAKVGRTAVAVTVDGTKAKVGRTAVAVTVRNHGTHRAPVGTQATKRTGKKLSTPCRLNLVPVRQSFPQIVVRSSSYGSSRM